MPRGLLMLFATILVLLNFVLSPSALYAIDTSKHNKGILVFNENDIATDERKIQQLQEDRRPTFVGDIVVGIRRPNEDVWKNYFSIINKNDQFFNIRYQLTIHGRKIHYFSAFNEEGSEVVACASPYVLGGSTAEFAVRVKPNSTSYFTTITAAR